MRPLNEWLNRVAEKYKQLASLKPNPDKKARQDKWVESSVLISIQRLEGQTTDESEVSEALRLIRTLVQSDGRAATLTLDLLLKLARTTEFRKGDGDPGIPLKPVPAEHLQSSVESACRWFAADSFLELNPVEQTSIVHLRLLEIQPFENRNLRAAILGASLFTMRSDLPPMIVTHDLENDYRDAIDEARRGNTEPMVELMATALERAMDEMIKLAK
jgi:hypothetical protein